MKLLERKIEVGYKLVFNEGLSLFVGKEFWENCLKLSFKFKNNFFQNKIIFNNGYRVYGFNINQLNYWQKVKYVKYFVFGFLVNKQITINLKLEEKGKEI